MIPTAALGLVTSELYFCINLQQHQCHSGNTCSCKSQNHNIRRTSRHRHVNQLNHKRSVRCTETRSFSRPLCANKELIEAAITLDTSTVEPRSDAARDGRLDIAKICCTLVSMLSVSVIMKNRTAGRYNIWNGYSLPTDDKRSIVVWIASTVCHEFQCQNRIQRVEQHRINLEFNNSRAHRSRCKRNVFLRRTKQGWCEVCSRKVESRLWKHIGQLVKSVGIGELENTSRLDQKDAFFHDARVFASRLRTNSRRRPHEWCGVDHWRLLHKNGCVV